MSNNKKALKSGVWYTVSNFFVKSIGFLTTPIFVRVLSKSEFGLYNNYISWLSIISIFVTLNLESTLISARYDYEKEFDKFILSMLSLSALSTLIWFVLINLFSNYAVLFTGIEQVYLNIMMAYLLFFPAVTMFQIKERYLFEYKKTVIVSLTLTAGTTLLSVLFVVTMQNRLLGRILGSSIPAIIWGILFYVYFIFKGRKINVSYWKYAFPICLPFIPHLLAGALLNSMDRVMINKWCGAEATAMYSLAYSCGAIVTLLVNSVNSAYAPWLGEKISERKYSEIRSFSKIYIACFMFFAMGIMLVAPEILWILGGNSYLDSKYVITPVAMGCVCQFLYTMFGNVEQFKRKTIGMAIATVIAAGINYILNTLMIPRIGYLAAAYTTLIGYLCLLGIHMYLVWKIDMSIVYDYKYIIGAVLIGILYTVVITISFHIIWMRILFIILYFVVAVFLILHYRDKFITVFKRR